MEFENLNVGDYIRWNASRFYKAWDTYGKIVKKTETEIYVFTFDDYSITKLSISGEAIRDEFKPAKKSDVPWRKRVWANIVRPRYNS